MKRALAIVLLLASAIGRASSATASDAGSSRSARPVRRSARRARRARPANRLAHPGGHGDDLRDGRRRTRRRRQQLRPLSRPRSTRLPRVGGLLDPDVERILATQAGSRHRLRHADRADAAARSRRHPVLQLRAPRARRHHDDDPGARRAHRLGGARRSSWPADIDRSARRDPRPDRRSAAPGDAAGVRARPGVAAQHLRERRLRLPARHARDRRRPQRLRRHQAAVGAGQHRDDPRPAGRT